MRTARSTTKTPLRPAAGRIAATKKATAKSTARKTTRETTARAPAVRKSTPAAAGAANELVPLLVYIPRRVRERLNKLVRDIELANQAEAISKLVNDAYRR